MIEKVGHQKLEEKPENGNIISSLLAQYPDGECRVCGSKMLWKGHIVCDWCGRLYTEKEMENMNWGSECSDCGRMLIPVPWDVGRPFTAGMICAKCFEDLQKFNAAAKRKEHGENHGGKLETITGGILVEIYNGYYTSSIAVHEMDSWPPEKKESVIVSLGEEYKRLAKIFGYEVTVVKGGSSGK